MDKAGNEEKVINLEFLEVKELNTYDYRDLLVYRKCGTVKEYFEYLRLFVMV